MTLSLPFIPGGRVHRGAVSPHNRLHSPHQGVCFPSGGHVSSSPAALKGPETKAKCVSEGSDKARMPSRQTWKCPWGTKSKLFALLTSERRSESSLRLPAGLRQSSLTCREVSSCRMFMSLPQPRSGHNESCTMTHLQVALTDHSDEGWG